MKMTLIRKFNPTSHVYQFDFQPEQPLSYIAGQFVEITLDHPDPDERGIRRWFTLSSSPSEAHVSFTVKCQAGMSSFKRTLRDLPLGSTVVAGDALGDFVLPLDVTRPLVWIAGGIGITPFRSIAKWLADTNDRRDIFLLHAVSNVSEQIYNDIFEAAGIPERGVLVTPAGQRPTTQNILDRLSDAPDRLFYISGPEAMVGDLAKDLQASGIAHSDIVTDMFLGYH